MAATITDFTVKNSLRCSRTCHKIPDIVRLRNGSQKLVLISCMDTRICVSISDWLVYYAPCGWSYSCEICHAIITIEWQAYTTPIHVYSRFESFARNSVSLRICPFCMIRGSLNISLSNNPVFLGGHFQSRAVRGHRSVWFPLLSACNL